MKIYEKIAKIVADLGVSLGITNVLDTKFWQDLIITLIVIVCNAIIFPLFKYFFNSLLEKMRLKGIISNEEFRKYMLEKNIKIDEQDVKTLIALYKEWKEKNKCVKKK